MFVVTHLWIVISNTARQCKTDVQADWDHPVANQSLSVRTQTLNPKP